MKLLSLFSGIGAFEKALSNLNVDYELVGFSEIDKWAIESYAAVHNVDVGKNLGDVSEITAEDLPDADLITYGFPCQDVSVAGRGAGIGQDTRSGLLYEAERIIEHVKPKHAIAENVKNLIGKRHREDFDDLLERLSDYGYNNYWDVLNAKEFGVPQNRERVFIVSIRKDIDNGTFEFPKGFDSGLRLKDMLLDEVEDKYYIENEKTQELLSKLAPSTEKQVVEQRTDEGLRFFKGGNVGTIRTVDAGGDKRVLEPMVVASRGRNPDNPSDRMTGSPTQQRLEVNEGGVSNTITTVQKDNWVLEPNDQNRLGGLYDDQQRRRQAGAVWDDEGVSPTLCTMQGGHREPSVVDDKRIRKLTPQECWRLMGFEDKDYWAARRRLEDKFYNGGDRSNSQMYKQAGNSIVVDVLEAIFKNLLGDDKR